MCCCCPVQVSGAEERLDHMTTVSVDRERLGEEIDEQQTLAVDIDNRRPRVHALSDSCPPHDRPAVDELVHRFVLFSHHAVCSVISANNLISVKRDC